MTTRRRGVARCCAARLVAALVTQLGGVGALAPASATDAVYTPRAAHDVATPVRKLSPPRLTVTALGPALIRLTAETPPDERVASILVQRTPQTGLYESLTISQGFSYQGSRGSALQDAEAATSYRYRASAQSGTSGVEASTWSDEVSVTTPAEPVQPPPPPPRRAAKPVSPFAVELSWDDRSDNEYGFELQHWVDDGRFVRLALVNPDTPRFVDHGLLPRTTARYRVRAFNPRGASTLSNEARARTPALSARPELVDDGAPTPSACTSRAEALHVLDDAGHPVAAQLERLDLGHGRLADLVTDPSTCAGAGCASALYARSAGCYRQIGDFFGNGITVVHGARGTWPLLANSARCNASEYTVWLLQFVNGRYAAVDRYLGCTSLPELTANRPPFWATCSESAPCQQAGSDVSPDEATSAPAD